jgi:hypothetical protein
MKETETVTISNRTWTSHPGSPQGTRAQMVDLAQMRRGPGLRSPWSS